MRGFGRFGWFGWFGRLSGLGGLRRIIRILPRGVAIGDRQQHWQRSGDHAFARTDLHHAALGMRCGGHRDGKSDRGKHARFDVGERGSVRLQHLAQPARYHQRCFGDIRAARESGRESNRLTSGDDVRDTAGYPGQAGWFSFASWWLVRTVGRVGHVLGICCGCAKAEQEQGNDSEGDDEMTIPGHGGFLVRSTAVTLYHGHRINPSISEIGISIFVLASPAGMAGDSVAL